MQISWMHVPVRQSVDDRHDYLLPGWSPRRGLHLRRHVQRHTSAGQSWHLHDQSISLVIIEQ